MIPNPRHLLACFVFAATLTSTACAGYPDSDWLTMSDEEFARSHANMAFSDSLEDRQIVAWLFFARVNQQIAGDNRVVMATGTVPLWMAWATDPETFTENPTFEYSENPRKDPHFVTRKDVLAGHISTTAAEGVPNGGNEEVTRNKLGYRYIVDSGMNTYQGVLDYVRAGNKVEMPIGSVETKMKWIDVNDRQPAPEGAMVFEFENDEKQKVRYWWGGMHIMVKMRAAPDDVFASEEPSWFWTTFEFTNNLGVADIREKFITQNVPIGNSRIKEILTVAGVEGIGLEEYSPNGTQIRFTVDGNGKDPVILGHSMMEDFAGFPDNADPTQWVTDSSSCHTCHATAAINPATGNYFPFTVPVGALSPYYSASGTTTQGCMSFATALGDGYVSLDFMWPIVFQALPYQCPSE